MKIAVIGAGITGVTTTYFLAKSGFKVDLIESRRYPAMATSYANGGQLSASNAEAWNSWTNTIYGIKKDVFIYTINQQYLISTAISHSSLQLIQICGNFAFNVCNIK